RDWSSDVCSSDLTPARDRLWIASRAGVYRFNPQTHEAEHFSLPVDLATGMGAIRSLAEDSMGQLWVDTHAGVYVLNPETGDVKHIGRSEEHTSELQSRENLVCRL